MNFIKPSSRILIPVLLFSFALGFSACDNNNDSDEELIVQTEGFVIIGITESGSRLVKYVEEVPSGTFDLSDGQDFPIFFPQAVFDHAMFTQRPDQTRGFSRYVVNQNGQLVENGVLNVFGDNSFAIEIRDTELGAFHDRSTSDVVTLFNPTTMDITGTIDMSAGPVPGDVNQRYNSFLFRGDDLFMTIRNNDTNGHFTSMII
ncbi:MAG: hypothetical protein AAFW89_14595, partial [Bacteroidota bacterium]